MCDIKKKSHSIAHPQNPHYNNLNLLNLPGSGNRKVHFVRLEDRNSQAKTLLGLIWFYSINPTDWRRGWSHQLCVSNVMTMNIWYLQAHCGWWNFVRRSVQHRKGHSVGNCEQSRKWESDSSRGKFVGLELSEEYSSERTNDDWLSEWLNLSRKRFRLSPWVDRKCKSNIRLKVRGFTLWRIAKYISIKTTSNEISYYWMDNNKPQIFSTHQPRQQQRHKTLSVSSIGDLYQLDLMGMSHKSGRKVCTAFPTIGRLGVFSPRDEVIIHKY